MRLTSLLLLILTLFSSSVIAQENTNFPAAPEWTLTDAQGNTVNLSDYRGKAVFLHFWATWCPYCKKVQPGLVDIYEKYQEQGLELVGISIREDEGAQPQAVLDKRGHGFKTLLFGEQVAKQYKVRGTPTTFFIDRQGRIAGSSNSSDPKDPLWEEAATYLLSGNSSQ